MSPTLSSTSETLLDCLCQPNHASNPDQAKAWERFARLYTPLLYEWARRQHFQEADIADVTQQVLVKLLAELPKYDRAAHPSFRGWLFAVARNQGRDFRRRKATRGLPQADGLSAVRDTEHLPAVEIEEAEYARYLVHRALELIRNEFTDSTFRAFEGCKIAGKSVAVVAVELALTPNAVHIACNRVMSRIRQEIEGLMK